MRTPPAVAAPLLEEGPGAGAGGGLWRLEEARRWMLALSLREEDAHAGGLVEDLSTLRSARQPVMAS